MTFSNRYNILVINQFNPLYYYHVLYITINYSNGKNFIKFIYLAISSNKAVTRNGFFVNNNNCTYINEFNWTRHQLYQFNLWLCDLVFYR